MIIESAQSGIKSNNIGLYKKGVTDIADAAKYFIHLYFYASAETVCGKQNINCYMGLSRNKTEYLLAIADLIYIKHKKHLFSEHITINECGVGYRELSLYFPKNDIKNGIEIKSIKLPAPKINLKKCDIPDEYKFFDKSFVKNNAPLCRLFNSIFMRFGAYSEKALGECFDEFKGNMASFKHLSHGKYTVDYKAADYLLNCGKTKSSDNAILNFIANYKL